MLSLTAKLFFTGLLISALPLALYQYIAFNQSSKILEMTHAKELRDKTALTSLLLNQSIAHRLSDMKIIAESIDAWLHAGETDSIMHQFTILHNVRYDISSISLLDANAKVLLSTASNLTQLSDISTELMPLFEHYVIYKTDDVAVSEAMLYGDEPRIFMLNRVAGKSDHFLLMEINFRNIELLLSNFEDDIAGAKYVYLLDTAGRIVFSHDPDTSPLKPFEDSAWLQPAMQIGEQTYRFTDRSGDDVIGTVESVSQFGSTGALGWRVVAFIPHAVIEENLRHALTPLKHTGIIIILAALLALYTFARTITTPINRIVQIANILRKGDYSARVKQKSSTSEINILATTLNALAATVEEHTTQLKEKNHLISINHEILEKQNRLLEKLSNTDRLTRLNNRAHLDRTFQDELQRAMRYGDNFSIILIDIDNFKKINDTFGHQAGDNVLQAVAEIFKRNVRETDTLGRWGGEEFLIISPKTDLPQADRLAIKLREALNGQCLLNIGLLTASFGIATYHKGDSIPMMISRADKALYRAKSAGRDKIELESA